MAKGKLVPTWTARFSVEAKPQFEAHKAYTEAAKVHTKVQVKQTGRTVEELQLRQRLRMQDLGHGMPHIDKRQPAMISMRGGKKNAR